MKNFKIALWIFAVMLVQTVILTQVRFYGIVPSIVVPFIICTAILENDFRNAVVTIVASVVAAAALGDRSFNVTVLMYSYAAILTLALRDKPLYVPLSVKSVFWTFVWSAVFEVVFYVMQTRTVNVSIFLYGALPAGTVNGVIAAVIYPMLKRMMYREEKKKLLIGDLV